MGEVCVAIDFETAGYKGYSACAVGLAKIEYLKITDQYYSLIRPPSSRVYFTNIHGLSWSDLKEERGFTLVWPEVLEFIKGADYFIAHNARFDRNVMQASCEYFKQILPAMPFLCTLKGSRKCLPLKSRKLSCVCQYLDIELNHHHAASDARGCGLIYIELISRGLSLREMLI